MDEEYDDYCYECSGYGDNYYIDDSGGWNAIAWNADDRQTGMNSLVVTIW